MKLKLRGRDLGLLLLDWCMDLRLHLRLRILRLLLLKLECWILF